MKIATPHTDADLLADYHQSGAVAVLGELYRRHAPLVLSVAMKYVKNQTDAEDVVMEIYEKLHLELRRQLDREAVGNFRSWLHVVVKNHCLMRLRKAGLKVDFVEVLPNPPMSDDTDLEDLLTKEKSLQHLEACLENLKTEQQRCVDLFFLKELSYKQISETTGLAFNDIKTHIQNGKLNLRKCLERKMAVEKSS
jgi:RNA polymerase sigma factor (sigma-70 family)